MRFLSSEWSILYLELSLSLIDILVKTSLSGLNATFSISANNMSALVHDSGSNIRLAGQLLLDNFFMTSMGGTLKHVLGMHLSCVSRQGWKSDPLK